MSKPCALALINIEVISWFHKSLFNIPRYLRCLFRPRDEELILSCVNNVTNGRFLKGMTCEMGNLHTMVKKSRLMFVDQSYRHRCESLRILHFDWLRYLLYLDWITIAPLSRVQIYSCGFVWAIHVSIAPRGPLISSMYTLSFWMKETSQHSSSFFYITFSILYFMPFLVQSTLWAETLPPY